MIAAAALVAGFGVAVLVYGPLGTPFHQLSGSTLGAPPRGVEFGSASEVLATDLNLSNVTGYPTWNWTNASGNFTGPCNETGIFNGTVFVGADNNATPVNISSGGNTTTLVCLNAVTDGSLNATWYNATNMVNSYANNFMPNGSYDNTTFGNVSSCNSWGNATTDATWNATHVLNATFTPCQTYYEMNNNTSYLPSFGGSWNGTAYTNSTLWNPGQSGYAPDDVIYQVPVVFTNSSVNGTYEIDIGIVGVTPVAQTFYFNDTIGNTTLANDTVLFVFDMTAAWLYDASINMTGNVTNASTVQIYGAVGLASVVVTECQAGFCPLAAQVL